jgi:hypothetical protein
MNEETLEHLRKQLEDAIDERDTYRDRALPEAAAIMNTLSREVKELHEKIDLLADIVARTSEALHRGEDETMDLPALAALRMASRDELTEQIVESDGRIRALQQELWARDTQNPVLHGWGVWHAEDEEWVWWGATFMLATDQVPEGPEYRHLRVLPADAVIVSTDDSDRAAMGISPDDPTGTFKHDPEMTRRLQQGFDDLAAGRGRDLGSFAAYLEDDET